MTKREDVLGTVCHFKEGAEKGRKLFPIIQHKEIMDVRGPQGALRNTAA